MSTSLSNIDVIEPTFDQAAHDAVDVDICLLFGRGRRHVGKLGGYGIIVEDPPTDGNTDP
ncbi:uncharacterized protein N7503_004891 [Penicillium pulvis]|uniref:uncharacterized protein n=1 Tax=Penicillium pulvis TaxID=1562058 RepID=UPI0025489E1D|nr:uncharacterized protein N7503_004891 [Penicillium pulvis]KAJ5802441.1 hypothetical protein N7503_004891 [Penicillium pulvis]